MHTHIYVHTHVLLSECMLHSSQTIGMDLGDKKRRFSKDGEEKQSSSM